MFIPPINSTRSSFLPPPDYSWCAFFLSPPRNSKGVGARAAVYVSLLPTTTPPQPHRNSWQLPRNYSRWVRDDGTKPSSPPKRVRILTFLFVKCLQKTNSLPPISSLILILCPFVPLSLLLYILLIKIKLIKTPQIIFCLYYLSYFFNLSFNFFTLSFNGVP